MSDDYQWRPWTTDQEQEELDRVVMELTFDAPPLAGDVRLKGRKGFGCVVHAEMARVRCISVIAPPDEGRAYDQDERQSVVRLLREVCADFGDNDWPDDLHLYDVIEKHLWRHLPEGWIPVEERLPDEGVEVLVFINYGGGHTYIERATWEPECGRWEDDAGCPEDNVTHWQPLPDPPKKENE